MQVAPPAGAALRQFSVFGNTGVVGSAGAGSIVDGDVGSWATDTVTNFPPSSVTPGHSVRHVVSGDGPLLIQADTDRTAAFVALTQPIDATLAANLAGQTLTTGVYDFVGGAALLPAGGTLTLNGAGVFVFMTGSSLTTVAGSNVTGTANPCNVYWQIGSSATIDSNNFYGQVFASASITVTGNLIGKAVAGAGPGGAVTMPVAGTRIGGCAAAAPAPGPPGSVPALPEAAVFGLLTLLLAGGAFVLGRP